LTTREANIELMQRLWGGSPAVVVDLVGANSKLGFSPTFSKRDNDQNRRKDILRGVLWWALTHRGGKNSNSRDTFQAVPIVGNIYQSLYNSRK
jgi:hypothetical protein